MKEVQPIHITETVSVEKLLFLPSWDSLQITGEDFLKESFHMKPKKVKASMLWSKEMLLRSDTPESSLRILKYNQVPYLAKDESLQEKKLRKLNLQIWLQLK